MSPVTQRKFVRFSLFATLLAIMLIFMIWPIVLTVSGGFQTPDGDFTLKYIYDFSATSAEQPGIGVLQDPQLRQGLINALMIAVCTTVLCMVITIPLAVVGTNYNFIGKGFVTNLILIPLILPPFVGAIGLRFLMGRFGSFNSALAEVGLLDPNAPGIDFLGGAAGGRFLGVVIMESLHLYPILYLNVSAALANLDPALEEAAIGLGAPRWKRFLKITFPLILPGIFAGSTIVFIWSFTELGTPLMFEYYTVTPVQIFFGIKEVADNPRPYALVVVMLTVAVGLYLIGRFSFGGKGHAMYSKASRAGGAKKLPLLPGLAAFAFFAIVIGLAILPHIGVILSSFTVDGAWYRSILPSEWTIEHYTHALSHPLAMGSIRNSLVLAIIATVLCVAIGLSISYLTTRVKVAGSWLLDSMAMLPLAVPGLVLAFGYVAMSLAWPFRPAAEALEGAGMKTAASFLQITSTNPNPFLFLIVAYAIRRLPYVVRAASAGLEQTSGELEEAALNLGASQMTAIRRIVVPLITANLIAGAILAFSFSMLEVSDSLILAQRENHYPITKAIFELFNRLGDGPYIASAMGVWGMALLTVTLVGASVLLGKKLGAIFRV